MSSKDEMARYMNGIGFAALGRLPEAIESYNKALKINPKNQDEWLNRGISLGSLSRYQEAIQRYARVLEINPKKRNGVVWSRRHSWIFWWFIGGDREFLSLLKINPRNQASHVNKEASLMSLACLPKVTENVDRSPKKPTLSKTLNLSDL